jgi:hypothetical protein
MRQIVRIRAGERAEVHVMKRPTTFDPVPPLPLEEQQVALITVEIHGGALQVFVHRHEGFDVPVQTHVV